MVQNQIRNHSKSIGLLVFANLIVLLVIGPLLSVQSFGTYILLPTLFIITVFRDRFTWDQGNFLVKILALYWVYSIVSVFYYVDFQGMMRDLSGLTGVLLASYCALALNKNENHERYYHWGFISAIILLMLIEFLNGHVFISSSGFEGAKTMADPYGDPRADRGIFLHNANAYSYFSYFANISLCYLYLKYRKKYVMVLLLILPIVFILFSFVTQSRSGLLLLIFTNVIFWVFILRNTSKNPLINIGRFVVIFGVLVFMAFQFISIFENSDIKDRLVQKDESTLEREGLIQEGINMFFDSPVIGVGLGQFSHYSSTRQFSHNSFVEILAEQGFIGGILLLFIFGIPALKSLKNVLLFPRSELTRLNVLFFFTFLVFNNVYVFYKFSFSMTYFFLIVAIQNKLTRSIEDENEAINKQFMVTDND
ncbi:O-antigen ligase family protein [Maribacter sp. R77961]|uniref:O-antigen ligase family protein n=1 Tax=Maribacter sp. R77961 TaxID=3093871 RepID=UPI0037C84ED5